MATPSKPEPRVPRLVEVLRQSRIACGRPTSWMTFPCASVWISRLGTLSLALPSLASQSVASGATAIPSGSYEPLRAPPVIVRTSVMTAGRSDTSMRKMLLTL